MTSSHLEEVKVSFYDSWVVQPPIGPEEVENILCECYDRSRENNVNTFHVSLNPIFGVPKDDRDDFVEQVQKAWPRFLQRGIVRLPFEPWILGRCYQDM